LSNLLRKIIATFAKSFWHPQTDFSEMLAFRNLDSDTIGEQLRLPRQRLTESNEEAQ
jgi:hypothetical protein